MLLLDTCALLWWTLDPEKLSDPAQKACRQIPFVPALISAISIWEVGIKIKKGKLDIGMDIKEYLKRVKMIAGLTIIAVDEDIWAENVLLDWNHRDPADRTIVATATLQQASIITKDSMIREFYPNTIW